MDNAERHGEHTKRRFFYYLAYSTAIALLIGIAVYAICDQARFSNALVESFIE
jgi:hypothetical protein